MWIPHLDVLCRKDKKEKVKECECYHNEGERNKITKHKLEKLREIGRKERNFYNIPDNGEVFCPPSFGVREGFGYRDVGLN